MNIDAVPPEIARLASELPKFPDGRIDYHTAAEAVALNVFVMRNNKLLLVKRGQKVGWLKGRWHVVAGFIDEPKTLREKAYEEIEEELGIKRISIGEMKAVAPLHEVLEKHWIIYPVLVELLEDPNITLDWENTDFMWVRPESAHEHGVIGSVLQGLSLLGVVGK